jgi:hypothetical protein
MKIRIFNVLALLALLLTGSVQAAQQVTFYHHDALGSVIAKSDQGGYLYLNEEYQPYGEKIYGTEDSFGASEDWYTDKNYTPTASWSVLRDFGPDPTFSESSTAFLGKNRLQVRARNQGTLDKEVRDGQVVWVTKRYCAGLLPGSVVFCYDWS